MEAVQQRPGEGLGGAQAQGLSLEEKYKKAKQIARSLQHHLNLRNATILAQKRSVKWFSTCQDASDVDVHAIIITDGRHPWVEAHWSRSTYACAAAMPGSVHFGQQQVHVRSHAPTCA